jgi:hypothetical protein
VKIFQAPAAVWNSYKRGSYERYTPEQHNPYIQDKLIRLGTYGDPAAVPQSAIETILSVGTGWTGYTHQWRDERFQWLRAYCMASADNADDAEQARAMGWRYFRVIPKDQINRANPSQYLALLPRESGCPGGIEQNGRMTCSSCKRCCGLTRANGYDVVINNHFNMRAPLEN